MDTRKQQAVPNSETVLSNDSPELSQASSSGHSTSTQHTGLNTDSESPTVHPASKRICIQSERSSANQLQVHSNPIDDTILSKRIGKQFLLNYM